MDKIRINLYDLLACLSSAQDLISKKLYHHHRQTAYLAYRLAEQMGFSSEQQYEVYLAGFIHDIGALSSKEKLELLEDEPVTMNSHAFRGAKLIENFKPLQTAAKIIKYHHAPWDFGKGSSYMGEDVPLASHIIELADRVCISIRPDRNILSQLPDILSAIRQQSDSQFHPAIVDALLHLSKKEYVWLDLTMQFPPASAQNWSDIHILDIHDIIDLAMIFSHIIDFRSSFTARHSAGVAKTAEHLAKLMHFSPYEQELMLIAGYLHDLGKIAISDDILEKTSRLDVDEFNEVRAHTYYTYRMLEPLESLKIVNIWASYHHEKLDGTGYPFHIAGDSLTLGSRIMAVADVFTAIAEHRPYRQGMSAQQIKQLLRSMAGRALDINVVNVLIEHFDEINAIRERAQAETAEQYKAFLLADQTAEQAALEV